MFTHFYIKNSQSFLAVSDDDLDNGVGAVVAETELDQMLHCLDSSDKLLHIHVRPASSPTPQDQCLQSSEHVEFIIEICSQDLGDFLDVDTLKMSVDDEINEADNDGHLSVG